MNIPRSTKYLFMTLVLLTCYLLGYEFVMLAYEYETVGHGLVPFISLPIAAFLFLVPFMKLRLI
jgi:hypothetical protein